MSFSPEPWDLLVWIEDHGRAGVVDVRQAFTRRQILELDVNEPGLQQVRTEPIPDDSLPLDFAGRGYPELPHGRERSQREMMQDLIDDAANREAAERLSSSHESMIQDFTDRERLIANFMNTARFTSRLEEGLTERPSRSNLHLHHATHPRLPGSTDGSSRISRPTSPMRYNDALNDFFRENDLGRAGNADRNMSARRRTSVVLSQGNAANNRPSGSGGAISETQPSITLSWTASPSELQSTPSDSLSRADPGNDPSTSGTESGMGARSHNPPSSAADIMWRRRIQRSSSIPRRSERPEATSEGRYDPPRLLNSEMRANVAAERLMRQRFPPNQDVHRRMSPGERYRQQQFMTFEQTRSPRWIRSMLNDLPDRSLAGETRGDEPNGTAGIGWGADGRTL